MVSEKQGEHASLKILLADDSCIGYNRIEWILKQNHHEVLKVDDGEKAAEFIAEGFNDVIARTIDNNRLWAIIYKYFYKKDHEGTQS